ncbi:hypothetical protein GCM10007207_14270 [Asaia siamensis]|uniref:Uncharacterized protein n=2 Tax=Asaia siamensis TaxID=110479 RepID=A0ABQ1LWT8_9PROT|nr:hypothetical protein AA0323_0213 [Asaia siamensis NRIC 0323]GGC29851.1 hypothetical protein GCM10007207_14270 [Asaia siamensis]
MSVVVIFLTVLALMTVSDETPTGRFLHRLMVVMPARMLNRITPLHILIAVAVIGLGAVLAWYGRGDGIRIAASTLPDAVVWLTTFEVSTYLDVVMMLATASALMRFRHLWSSMLNVKARLLMRLKTRRKRSR